MIENWYKFLFTFSQLRPRIVSDRCCWKRAATTIHSLTTYDTLVKQTTSMNTIPKWNLQFIQVMHRPTTHGILEKCSRLPNIMKEKKRNKSKACWWKNSITRTLNFWLKFCTKFCALYSNKYGIYVYLWILFWKIKCVAVYWL